MAVVSGRSPPVNRANHNQNPPHHTMAVARVTEIKSSSKKSFDDAIKSGIAKATKTIDKIKGAWIAEQEVVVDGDKITEYRVLMKVTFIVK